MSNIATTLLDFILDLLRDPAKAQQFNADPHATLASAGLSGVTPNDVSAVMPMVADCSPVRDWQGAVSAYHPSPEHQQSAHQAHDVSSGHPGAVDRGQHDDHCPPKQSNHDNHDNHDKDHRPSPGQDHGSEHQGQEYAVIQHLQYIQNTYSVTEIDASHSIWAGGDANVLFGDHDVLATHGSVVLDHAATHGSISVDNTHTSVDVSVKDSLNGSFDSAGGKGAVAGNGNHVDNSEKTDSHDTRYQNTGDVSTAGGDQANGNTLNATSVRGDGNATGEHATTTNQTGDGNANGGHATATTVRGDGNATGEHAAVHATNSFDTISHSDVAGGDLHNGDSYDHSPTYTDSFDDQSHPSATFTDSLNDNSDNSSTDNSTHISHSYDGNDVASHNAIAVHDAAADSGHDALLLAH
jgi:hypothetical protein